VRRVSLWHLWIFLAATLCAGGWILSYFGLLNFVGYLGLLGSFAVWGCWAWRSRFRGGKFQWRFSHLVPALYLAILVLSALGGILYEPVHPDGLSYRVPRALRWLEESRWHWIHSADHRLNVVAPGFDWMSAPVLLFLRDERWIALLNVCSFALLPGAIFCGFHRLGVPKRTAWWWMWILPSSALVYAMQAASLGSDSFAAVFTLSAVALGLRYRETKSPFDFWASFLALMVATGTKQSNLPLLLPGLIVLWPHISAVWRRPLISLGVVSIGILASALPITLANVYHGLHWSGFGPGHDFAPSSPIAGLAGNSVWIVASNFIPPIFPLARQWNAAADRFVASDWGMPFRSMEVFGHAPKTANEIFCGFGFMALTFLLVSWFLARRINREKKGGPLARWVRWSVWFCFAVFLAKVGLNQIYRYAAPYYLLLVPTFLLARGTVELTRWRAWRSVAALMALVVLGLVIISRERPLFPAQTLYSGLGQKPALRSWVFFSEYRNQLDGLLARIPADEKTIGYAVRMGFVEPALRKPYGSRKVIRILNSDEPADVLKLPIRYALVDPSALDGFYDPALVIEIPSARSRAMTIEEWTREYGAELVARANGPAAKGETAREFYLVRWDKR
jgi:hypothetical protein